MPKKFTYQFIFDYFKDNKCTLLLNIQDFSTIYKSSNTRLKYIAICGHETDLSFTRFKEGKGRECKNCSGYKYTYDRVKQIFEENECKLLLNIDEFFATYKNVHTVLKYTAMCGHESNIKFLLFIQGSGRECCVCSGFVYTYERVKHIFEKFNCELLLSSQEFANAFGDTIKREHNDNRLLYRAKCGHTKYTTLRSFERFGFEQCKRCADGCPTYNYVQTMLKSKNMELCLTELEFDNFYKNATSVLPYKDICGCIKESTYVNLCGINGAICKLCGRNNNRLSYSDIKEFMDSLKLTLITTEEEFIENYKRAKDYVFQYYGTCSHKCISNYYTLQQGYNTQCEICSHITRKDNMREMFAGNNKLLPMETEMTAISILKTYIGEHFYVSKAWDGCESDIIIKPKHIKENLHIGLQIKSTNKANKTNMYTFSNCDKYDMDILLVFVCIEDHKIWIIPNLEYKNDINKYGIGLRLSKRSKYYKYFINTSTINNTLHKYYNSLHKYTFEELDTPKSELQQLEKEFHCNFNSKVPVQYKLTKNEMEGMVYDATIMNKKIQEKVLTYNRLGTPTTLLRKSGGRDENGKLTKIPYELGDCDFYLLHSKCKNIFYLVPEQDIYDNVIKKIKTAHLTIGVRCKWIEKYMFEYDNLDIDRLEALFEIN